MGMVLQAIPEGVNPKVKTFREKLRSNIKERSGRYMLMKFGSCLAMGILDGGGRNSVITLSS